MKILIVNDDGYRGPGLHGLIKGLKDEHELVVAVPATEKSGTSNSITFRTPLSMERIYLPQVDHDVWLIDGTPADCSAIALDQLMDGRPDVLVSGINNGLNIADAVLYSGTVAAALQGAMQGIPTFALSGDFSCENFSACAEIFKKLLPVFMENEKGKSFFYNINFPNLPIEKIKGIRNTVISNGRMQNHFEKRKSPNGSDYYWHAYQYDGVNDIIECNDPKSDVVAVHEGYISITPMKLDYFDREKFKRMPDFSEILSEIKADESSPSR